MTPAQRSWLKRIAVTGTWPDRPFLRDTENSLPLMRAGLVEVIKPEPIPGRAPGLSYARITPSGLTALKGPAE